MVVFLFGLLFLLLRKKQKPSIQIPDALPGAAARASGPALPAETVPQHGDQVAIRSAAQGQLEDEIANYLTATVPTTKKAEVLVNHLREIIKKDSTNTVNVVRTWLNEKAGAEVA